MRSAAADGKSVTVAMMIVLSDVIVIIVLCHCQGAYGGHKVLYICHVLDNVAFFGIFHAASYRVKPRSPSEGEYQLEDTEEAQWEYNPAYETVNTS